MKIEKSDMFRIMGIAFYKDTGVLPPGCDEPSANPSGKTYQQRLDEYMNWKRVHGHAVRSTVGAINELFE